MDTIWTHFNAALPAAVRPKDTMASSQMQRRDTRLKDAKKNADRCNRNLARDRTLLDHTEQKLMREIRQFAAKGDIVKARIAARQIAHYRTAADRNYESAAIIATRAQLMVSNHKINQAKVEALKGARYACFEDTLEKVADRELKYAQMMSMQEEMESIMNEGMDEVYDAAEEYIKKRDYFDLETDAILKQALDPTQYLGRTYTETASSSTSRARGKILIHFRIYDPRELPNIIFVGHRSSSRTAFEGSSSGCGKGFPKTPTTNPSGENDSDSSNSVSPACSPQISKKTLAENNFPPAAGSSFRISTLDLSVDMLKNLMIRDASLMTNLRLNVSKNSAYDLILGASLPFRLGNIVTRNGTPVSSYDQLEEGEGRFEEFDFVRSLKDLGIENGSVIWVFS